MALLFSTATAPSCALNTIPKWPVPKIVSNGSALNLTGSFIVLDAKSSILVNALRKLKPYGLATVRFLQHNKPYGFSHFHSSLLVLLKQNEGARRKFMTATSRNVKVYPSISFEILFR